MASSTTRSRAPRGSCSSPAPTGSGKTSTLYSFLGHLVGEETKIVTLEDPVEYQLPGVSQTQINDRIGFSFARALRTVLRQDPDVVMVGEIRDPETAELALQASLTGHVVFSTLHTNSASGAVTRLRDLGVPSYLVATSVTAILAQRLVRRVCDACAVPVEVDSAQLQLLRLHPRAFEGARVRVGEGCSRCNGTGYRGRHGIYEVLAVDGAASDLIARDAAESAIRSAGRAAGARSLREDALRLVAAGVTTIDEVLRVTTGEVAGNDECATCGGQVEPDYSHCPWCAARLRRSACPSCHRELEAGWKACPGCGTSTLEEGSDDAALQPSAVSAAGEPDALSPALAAGR